MKIVVAIEWDNSEDVSHLCPNKIKLALLKICKGVEFEVTDVTQDLIVSKAVKYRQLIIHEGVEVLTDFAYKGRFLRWSTEGKKQVALVLTEAGTVEFILPFNLQFQTEILDNI